MLFESLALANERHIGANGARVQEHAVVHVADVHADNRPIASDERRLTEVGRDAVIPGEVVESSPGENREFGLGPGDQRCSRGYSAIPACNQDPSGPFLDRLLETFLQLVWLNRLELKPGGRNAFPGSFGISAGIVEESLESRAVNGRTSCHGGGRGRREVGSGIGGYPLYKKDADPRWPASFRTALLPLPASRFPLSSRIP